MCNIAADTIGDLVKSHACALCLEGKKLTLLRCSLTFSQPQFQGQS